MKTGNTHTGLRAAACTLMSTSPFFGFGTGTSPYLSTFSGSPLAVTLHDLCVVGIEFEGAAAAAAGADVCVWSVDIVR